VSTIIPDRQAAEGYDEQARQTDWFGPDVVFGLVYEFVRPGDVIVDLGIGSGLSALPFHKAGARVFGLDGSSEVLAVCSAKGFTEDLKLHDLRRLPLPYDSAFFDHAVCVAVLNSFQDLTGFFDEVARILTARGTFAFTVESRAADQTDHYAINRVDVSDAPRMETAVTLYRHARADVAACLMRSGLVTLKTLDFVAFRYPAEKRDVVFTAYVARKTG